MQVQHDLVQRRDAIDSGALERARKVAKMERSVLQMMRDGRLSAILRFVVEVAHGPGLRYDDPRRLRAQALLQMPARRGRGDSYGNEEREQAAAMLRDGSTLSEVALRLGRTRDAIRNAIQRGTIDFPESRRRRRVQIPSGLLRRASDLRASGLTWKKIERAIGYSATAIKRRLRK